LSEIGKPRFKFRNELPLGEVAAQKDFLDELSLLGADADLRNGYAHNVTIVSARA